MFSRFGSGPAKHKRASAPHPQQRAESSRNPDFQGNESMPFFTSLQATLNCGDGSGGLEAVHQTHVEGQAVMIHIPVNGSLEVMVIVADCALGVAIHPLDKATHMFTAE